VPSTCTVCSRHLSLMICATWHASEIFVHSGQWMCRSKTYILSTAGYTGTVFMAGCAQFWMPNAFVYAFGVTHPHITTADKARCGHTLCPHTRSVQYRSGIWWHCRRDGHFGRSHGWLVG
jgi:hypothetical protein